MVFALDEVHGLPPELMGATGEEDFGPPPFSIVAFVMRPLVFVMLFVLAMLITP